MLGVGRTKRQLMLDSRGGHQGVGQAQARLQGVFLQVNAGPVSVVFRQRDHGKIQVL